jgi:AsmA protein
VKILFGVIAALVGLVLILAAAFAVVLWNFDPNNYKDEIIAMVRKETGRELKLEGDLKLSFYPWLGIEADGVTLGNAPGFGEAPFLRAGHLRVRAKLMPLLRKTVEMDTIRLDGAELNLARNKAGLANWSDLTGGGAEKKPQPLRLAALAVGGVDIKDARFSWTDETRGQVVKVSDLNAQTGALTLGEPVRLSAAANIEANKPAVAGALALDGTVAYQLDRGRFTLTPFETKGQFKGKNFPGGTADLRFTAAADIDLDAGTATVTGLNLDALGANLKGALNASKIKSESPAVSGDVAMHGPDLALIFRALEIEPLASQIARIADKSFALSGKFDADMTTGALRVKDLSARVVGSAIRGDLEGAGLRTKTPALRGEIAAKGPDLSALLLLAGQFEAGKEAGLGSMGQRLAGLSSKSFDFRTRFDADWKSGRIDLPEFTAAAFGVSARGSLKAAGDSLNGDVDVRGTNPGELLAAFGQRPLAEVLQAISAQAKLSGSLDNLSIKPLEARASFAGGQIPGGPVDLTLYSTVTANLGKETLTVGEMKLAGLGLNVEGNFHATKIKSNQAAFQGAIKMAPFSLRKLMTQLNQKLPPMADANALHKLALETKLSGTANSLAAQDLDLLFDDSRLKGEVAVSNFRDPDVTFKVSVDTLRADRYRAPRQKGGGKPQPTTTAPSAPPAAAKLPMEELRTLKLKGDLRVGQLVLANLKLNNVKLGVQARDGKISASPITADLYQGAAKGSLDIDATGRTAKLTLDGQLLGIQAEPLLIDLHGKSRLRGRGDLDARFSATGDDAVAIKRSLNGQAKLAFKDGAYKGVNIGKVLRSLQGDVVGADEAEATDFTELDATVVCSGGVCRNQDLLMKSPLLRAGGSGTVVNLANDQIDYTLQVTIVRTAEGQGGPELEKLKGKTIPIKISGTMGDPKFKPDFGELAKKRLEREIEKQIEKRLGKDKPGGESGKEAVKDALKKMLKF